MTRSFLLARIETYTPYDWVICLASAQAMYDKFHCPQCNGSGGH